MVTIVSGVAMIEKFEDLELDSIKSETESDVDTMVQQIDARLQEKLGVSFAGLKQALSEYVLAHAEELTHEFVNIAPYGDYGKLLEDNDSMAEFFKTEGHKVENWEVQGLTPHDVHKNLITFHFANKSVDDGDVFQGFVYVSFQGKIRHAFAQNSDN